MRGWKGLALLAVLSVLTGCLSWFEDDEDTPIEGKRVSVLQHLQTLSPDPQAATEPVVLPPASVNRDWPQAGGSVTHAMQHLVAPGPITVRWRMHVGEGISDSSPLLAPPVVGAGRVFAMDTEHKVSAHDVETGARVWHTDLAAKTDDDDALVGGLAYDGGRVFATTGFGAIVALDAADGREVWRKSVSTPLHGPPTIEGGRLYVISVDNVLYAYTVADGLQVWPPLRSIAEPAAMLGAANPAATAGLVIAPFSSGELIAIREDNGRVLWNETLGSQRRTDELALLADIRARPVIDGNRVFAISFSGAIAAFDLRNGQRIWEREIGSLHTPWIAGRFLFVVSTDNQLVCLSTVDGAIVWVVQLPTFRNEKDRKHPIIWTGPVLTSDQLFVFGTHGIVLGFSPQDGREQTRIRLASGVSVEPAIAGGTLFVLDDDAVLTAYR